MKTQSEERAHCQHLCVYKNVGACLSRLVCVCVCVLFLTVCGVVFVFSAVVEAVIKVCIISLGAEILN